jgi:hypothetical protein
MLGRLVSSSLEGSESAIIKDAASRFGPLVAKQLTTKVCKHKQAFYRKLMTVFVPAFLTWLLIQSIAAITKNNSRWVNIFAVTAAFGVFALTWFIVVDKAWTKLCKDD